MERNLGKGGEERTRLVKRFGKEHLSRALRNISKRLGLPAPTTSVTELLEKVREIHPDQTQCEILGDDECRIFLKAVARNKNN